MPNIERLEDRQLLVANPLASAESSIFRSDGAQTAGSSTIELMVESEVSQVSLGLMVAPLETTSGLELAAPEVFLDGVSIPSVAANSASAAGYVLTEFVTGQTYSIVVRDVGDAGGDFKLDVFLPGDKDGDGLIDVDEVAHVSAATIQSQFGGNHVSELFFRQRGFSLAVNLYQEELDANFDGLIDTFDLAMAQQNQGLGEVSVQLVTDEGAPAVSASIDPDTGISTVDGLTNDPNFVIRGTATDNFGITQLSAALDDDNDTSFVSLLTDEFLGPLDPTGQLDFELTVDQLELLGGIGDGSLENSGTHTLFLKASDEFGNATVAPVAVGFELDTIPPEAPTVPELVDAADGILNFGTPTIRVTPTEPGGTVRLSSNLVVGPTGESTADGTVTITTAELPDGRHEITASMIDAAGNEGNASPALTILIDQGAPGLDDFALDPPADSTDPQGNLVTALDTVDLVGRTEGGISVELRSDGQTVQAVTSDSLGEFRFRDVELNFGASTFEIVATDIAENRSTFTRSIVRDASPSVVAPLGQLDLDEDAPVERIDLLTVFTDDDLDDGDSLSFFVVNDNPSLIEHELDGTTLALTPQLNQNGTAELTIRATDSLGVFAEDTVMINVAAINDPPVANVPSRISVAANAVTVLSGISITDVDADPDDTAFVSLEVEVGLMDMTAVGSVTFTFGDGTDNPEIIIRGQLADVNASLATLSYEPPAGFVGETNLTVRPNDAGNTGAGGDLEDFETIIIAAVVNDAPVAFNDDFATDEDTPITGNVLVNNGNGTDRDPDGDDAGLRVSNTGTLTTALNATVSLSANGDFAYDPTGSEIIQSTAAGEARVDLFEYVLTDGTSTDTGTVTIDLTGINDPPVPSDDDFTAFSDTIIFGNLLVDNGHGPDMDVDGTLTVVSVGSITTDLGGTAQVSDTGGFTYDPAGAAAIQALPQGESLVDFFDYTVTDGLATGTARASITVTSNNSNRPPLAVPDTFQLDVASENSLLSVLDNDSTGLDLGEQLTITAVGDSDSGGSVAVSEDGLSLLYTGASGFLGTDHFTYTIDDGNGGTAETVVTVQVTAGEAPIDDHIHATLSVFVNGQRLADPPINIGVSATTPETVFTSTIHTHDGDGRLHSHPINGQPRTESDTLGDFLIPGGQTPDWLETIRTPSSTPARSMTTSSTTNTSFVCTSMAFPTRISRTTCWRMKM